MLLFFFKQKTAYEIMPSLVGSEMCIRDSPRTWSGVAGDVISLSWLWYPRAGLLDTSSFTLSECGRYSSVILISHRYVQRFSATSVISASWKGSTSTLAASSNLPARVSFCNAKSRSSEKRGEPKASPKAVPPLNTSSLPLVDSKRPFRKRTSQYSLTTWVTSIFSSPASRSASNCSMMLNNNVKLNGIVIQYAPHLTRSHLPVDPESQKGRGSIKTVFKLHHCAPGPGVCSLNEPGLPLHFDPPFSLAGK